MRVVATEYLSLDGVFEEPGQWSGPFFAAAWPTMPGTGEFGEKMNSMPKYVVSSTLDTAEWSGSRLIKGDAARAVRDLKQEPGQDLLLSGSAQLFNALRREGLIDLYRFMVHPIVLGRGARLFNGGDDQTTLSLARTKSFSSGIVILEYEPAGQP
jgi:dihydrofolate reductase